MKKIEKYTFEMNFTEKICIKKLFLCMKAIFKSVYKDFYIDINTGKNAQNNVAGMMFIGVNFRKFENIEKTIAFLL